MSLASQGGASRDAEGDDDGGRNLVLFRCTIVSIESRVLIKNRGTHPLSCHLAAKLTPHPQLPSLFGFSAIANELLIISST